ncbi:MAG: hypothetical protein J1F64_08540 [Oscillospiraceae bacterium]|nr:hypothetical protein [Oscillospiraceae bacterium]
MKGISSNKDHVMKCIDNSKTVRPGGFTLAEHIRSYLYAMIYPPIFEICTHNSSDIIYSEYPMFLDLWCNMLEDAIILDGICDALHTSFFKLLNPRKYNLLRSDGTYSFDIFKNIKDKQNTDSQDYIDYLVLLYENYVKFTCIVDKKRLEKNNSSERFRSINAMINYQFIQSGNRGIIMRGYIGDCIGTLTDLHGTPNNNAKCNFAKLYTQYNFQRQLHLFDFIWHSEYDSVDFHLTHGFITNYVLYKIMRHNDLLYPSIVDKYENEQFEFSKSYRSKSSSDLFLKDSIETYDIEFINNLIGKCSKSLQQYDLCFKEQQAKNLYSVINNNVVVHSLVDSFVHYLDKLYDNSFDEKIKTIWDNSSDYYTKIYEDKNKGNTD